MTESTTVYSETNPPAAPTAAATDSLNVIRERFGIFPTAFSDVFSTFVDDNSSPDAGDTLGQRALKIVGRSFRSNTKAPWSKQLTQERISAIPIWRTITDDGSTAARTKFANAYSLVDACTYGMWAMRNTPPIAPEEKLAEEKTSFPFIPRTCAIWPTDLSPTATSLAAATIKPWVT
ncbi:hypothetical protein [Carnimonas bestiolae]|uniref:hypothetical protein n=1 Tax=Carnimonas bestiolae TaxID=3402172 RepID=UPI003F4AAADB